jgi:hypothetical protein
MKPDAGQIFEKYLKTKFRENPSGAELFHAGGHDSRFTQFCERP